VRRYAEPENPTLRMRQRREVWGARKIKTTFKTKSTGKIVWVCHESRAKQAAAVPQDEQDTEIRIHPA